MNIKIEKTYKKLIWLALIFLAGVFVPTFFGIDGFSGGFAISFVSGMLCLTFIISAVVIRGAAKQARDLVDGKGLLTHWTYTLEEWQHYTEVEHALDGDAKKILVYVISGVALVLGILYFIADQKAGGVVLLVMLAMIVLINIIARIAVARNYERNKNNVGEAYIGLYGVLLNGQYTSWTTFGTRLESAKLETSDGVKLIALTTSQLTKNGRIYNDIRVPVPTQEKNFEVVLGELNKLIKN